MTPVVICRALTRLYELAGVAPVLAVDRVDLTVAPGEFVAVEGPSGSGKTTLLGLLVGLEVPTEGFVSLLGHDLARLTPAERARLRRGRIGLVLQSFGLVDSLSVNENVALPLALAGVDRSSRSTRAAALLAEVGLEEHAAARIDELSGGERQRVAVARALIAEPALILADEPTGSLDDETGEAILELLRGAIATHGSSLVLVTHDPSSAAHADRRLRMRDGRLIAA
ncbi:MAG: ABC transporter ATP-binding protein [Chloroflexota bacterium]|nr:ABC transporter ATP-binding protein [Chloroflexota bacterium]